MPSDDPIVISAAGVICHAASSIEALTASILQGRRRPLDTWEPAVAHGCRCTRIGRVGDDLSDEALEIDRRSSRFMGRASRLALRAARDAIRAAKLDDLTEAAVIVGSGAGDTQTHIDTQDRLAETRSARRVGPTVVPRLMGSTVSANLAAILRASGPSASVAAACAGGAWNLAVAASLVREGQCEVALAGGVEILDLHFHAGFDAMRAYCADADGTALTASRPYAADRAGFIFGEGAGVLVVERLSRARARGVTPLAALLAVGLGSDGTGEMVAPSAAGAERAMRAALRLARLAPSDIGYVNAHATSTPVGDVSEARAIHAVLGERVQYASTKGFTGHTISAAGAIEAALTAVALRDGTSLPCAPIPEVDPALADHPPLVAPAPLRTPFALSNSFGFGGTNACVALGALQA